MHLVNEARQVTEGHGIIGDVCSDNLGGEDQQVFGLYALCHASAVPPRPSSPLVVFSGVCETNVKRTIVVPAYFAIDLKYEYLA